jgi:hypothetical protein
MSNIFGNMEEKYSEALSSLTPEPPRASSPVYADARVSDAARQH